MAEISDLLVIDDNNTTRWPEGMQFSQVNNAARKDEGLLARWYQDTNGSLAASGAANTYAITANRALTSYLDKLTLAFVPNSTNTGAATLNVSGLGNITITRPDGTTLLPGDIVSGQVVWVVYIAAQAKFQLLSLPAAASQQISIPVGTIMIWPTENIPAGTLECNGQAVSRTTFAALFAAHGVRYGAGDGSTTFNVPDYRGFFLRGQDHGAGRDPDAGIRLPRLDGVAGDNPGTTQVDGIKSHTHTAGGTTDTQGSHTHPDNVVRSTDLSPVDGGSGAAQRIASTGQLQTAGAHSHNLNVTVNNTGGNETRGVNINVRFVVIATPAAALPTSGIGLNDQWVGARLMTAMAVNGATSSTRDTSTNHLTQPVFSFSNAANNFVVFEWTPPKRWNGGTVTFVPQWTADAGTPGNFVKWTLAAVARNDGDATDLAVGTLQSTTEALSATGKQHNAPESAAITIAGTLNPGCTVLFVLGRDTTVGSNLAAAALLFGAKLRWTSNAVSDN